VHEYVRELIVEGVMVLEKYRKQPDYETEYWRVRWLKVVGIY